MYLLKLYNEMRKTISEVFHNVKWLIKDSWKEDNTKIPAKAGI